MTPSVPIFQSVVISSSAQIGVTGERKIWKVCLAGGSAASKLELKNAATDTGDVLFTLNALTNDYKSESFSDVGSIPFSTACYAKLSGTGALAYVWYE